MTTFKNNSKYAELLFIYLDVAVREEFPLTVPEVLRAFKWTFKGGSLYGASQQTRLKPETSVDEYPDGSTISIADAWPEGKHARSLQRILVRRRAENIVRTRAALARIGTYQMLTSTYGLGDFSCLLVSGLSSVYHVFGIIWDWSLGVGLDSTWDLLTNYMRELMFGSCSPSLIDLGTAERSRMGLMKTLSQSRVPQLLRAVMQIKEIIRVMGSSASRRYAREMGLRERDRWDESLGVDLHLSDVGMEVLCTNCPVGPTHVSVSQEVAMMGHGRLRHTLGKCDIERLHQLVMSAASALVGVAAQACVGTPNQKSRATMAVHVADRNITRIVESSRKVAAGDEVLVCKGYRRAYTAHLARLAGPLCASEYSELVREAESTAPEGILDIRGFLADLKPLDATSSLNAGKAFKICPAPDVSPARAMMDRITQIGDGNTVDTGAMNDFRVELRAQILRAYIRSTSKRLALRPGVERPVWYGEYLRGNLDHVPSAEIHDNLVWEATADMPDMSPYDPSHWKDSGLGADTIWESQYKPNLGDHRNMLMRLIFDDDCPMPGVLGLNSEHVIKLFVKAEGHKDPARAIFSANLRDRQAQSWMERGVENVAIHHPSYMIGQEVDVKIARVAELTKAPAAAGFMAMYYSFDISGWSARMPAEPQLISHHLWSELYGGHLFKRAREINEDAHIYMTLGGYWGWYKNTHSNLEGFNGKEMTMVLVALLSLSVRRWRIRVSELKIIPSSVANSISALLFAYIDDGVSRIDLHKSYAVEAFEVYKTTVIETFASCGFTVEVSKCFPSDRFAIFLNEVYLAGRHVVHGVRAAMAISSEPTERHTSLVERVTSVCTGVRGAVMAGLNPLSAVFLMAYHVLLHMLEWVHERDPVLLAIWSVTPRSWGGLGMPNALQLFVSGSGAAFEEGVATLQCYAHLNTAAKAYFLKMSKCNLEDRSAAGVLTAPLSGHVRKGYMVDSRVANMVRRALRVCNENGRLSAYAGRLLRYADTADFERYADAIVPLGYTEVLQEQMLTNLADAHPHSIFAAFAKRLEKSTTVMAIVGRRLFGEILHENRLEAARSAESIRDVVST